MSEIKEPTFKLGITMAGAISAGAYTAGVIDYLLESMSKWEDAKKTGDTSIPQHKVILEVLGGASAGGMTAAVTCLGLLTGIKPYGIGKGEDNLLYDLWVKMVDDRDKLTIDKMLDTCDLDDKDGLDSFLNSDVIEEIGKKAITDKPKNTKKLPSYISKDLDLIMTISNLRGIPLKIIFDNYIEPASIVKHDGHIHYKFRPNSSQEKKKAYKVFDFSDQDYKELKERAIATGAFPFGFKPVKLKILNKYIKTYFDSRYKNELEQKSLSYDEKIFDKEGVYDFVAVDGGMLNNEPLALTYNALKESGINENKKDHAIIMVDPFPSNVKLEDNYEADIDVISTAKGIVKSFMNQTKYSQEDLFKAISDRELTRFFIAPKPDNLKENKRKQEHTLACGGFGGFSGFFSQLFREHDFQLGRRNCADFIRYHFALPEDDNNDIHKNWTTEMKERFRFYKSMKLIDGKWVPGRYHLPIIPDINIKKAEGTPPYYFKKFEEFQQEIEKNISESLAYLDFPSITKSQVQSYKKVVKIRVKKCTRILLDQTQLSAIVKSLIRNRIGNAVSKWIMKYILEEGKSYGIIKEKE